MFWWPLFLQPLGSWFFRSSFHLSVVPLPCARGPDSSVPPAPTAGAEGRCKEEGDLNCCSGSSPLLGSSHRLKVGKEEKGRRSRPEWWRGGREEESAPCEVLAREVLAPELLLRRPLQHVTREASISRLWACSFAVAAVTGPQPGGLRRERHCPRGLQGPSECKVSARPFLPRAGGESLFLTF